MYNDGGKVALSDPELIALEQIVSVVQETAFYHSSSFSVSEIKALKTLIFQWPAELVFPALDLLRLVLVHPQGPSALGESTLVELVGRMLHLGLQSKGANGEDLPAATRMLALRVLANMFLQEAGRKALLARKDEVSACHHFELFERMAVLTFALMIQVLAKLQEFIVFRQKTVALSLATVLLK